MPTTIAVLVVNLCGLAYIAHDLSVTRAAMQTQIVELKERLDTTRTRLDANTEKSQQLKEELSSTKSSLGSQLGATRREVEATKKTAKELEQEQKQAAQQLGSQISSVREEAASKVNVVAGEVGGVKTGLEATRKDLEATKGQLKSAMGDLGVQSGLIARNSDELAELKRRGERNYFEFNLGKEKNPKRIGDISIRLTKTDPKKGRYTLEVVAEDKKVEKRDKTVNEPVQFYVARARIPYEIVVNQVNKDTVVGYLATPK
jgi:uncharacterized protein (DUF3084 family)